MLHLALVLAALLLGSPATPDGDLREGYDVLAYELDLRVDPDERLLSGTVTTRALVLAETLEVFQLDMVDALRVEEVRVDGVEVPYTHEHNGLFCRLPEPAERGGELEVAVRYTGHPRALDAFSGFHWAKTADGRPWINTSCQGPGAHSWWPCKASYYHPEDKPESVAMDVTVPRELYAVSNGRLEGILENGEERTFRWRHDYPLETYSVTLNAAPYVAVESEIELPEHDTPLRFVYYVLPDSVEKAAVQFAQVPELLRIYTEAFGPFPFERSKFGLVQTNFWGMEHSTAVAYGSSFPAWCEKTGAKDGYAGRNRWFDYILVHEVAHEWWGNGVSATDWGHFWIHEGFGTYAEGIYVERTRGREAADEYFAEQQARALRSGPKSRLYRGEGVDSGEAYDGVIYSKGASVLNTMRVWMDDDEAWWKALREFNLRFRYGNASSEDFREVLEEHSDLDWRPIFDSWVYGEGYPRLSGKVSAGEASIALSLVNEGSGETGFAVPLDLAWTEGGEPRMRRVLVPPGDVSLEIPCEAPPEGLRVVHLDRVLGEHEVVVE